MPPLSQTHDEAAPSRPLDVTAIHAAHGDFVWLTLQRFGVPDADLADVHQEVFVVVHNRLHTYDGQARVTTWLFGICTRVAAAYRRQAYVRRERAVESVPDEVSADSGPEDAATTQQARERLRAILDELDLEKRVVFVMFEIDDLPAEEIATIIGVPVGTVHSRLRAARKQFERAVARWKARDGAGAR